MSSFFEIHELSTGEFILKRGDDSANEALVTIKFSAESLHFLGGARFEVAKAMLEAGMEAASELNEQAGEEIVNDAVDQEQWVLH